MTQKPDAFHQHEALHTAHVLLSTWEEFVEKSPYVSSDPHILAACVAAGAAMASAYAAIGEEEVGQ